MAEPSDTKRAMASRERTINFYEIVKVVDAHRSDRMKQADWDQILQNLEGVPLRNRVVDTPTRTLIGEVLVVGGKRHLKLMKVRDKNAWLEIYDQDADSIGALALSDASQLLETSIIAFLDFGNVVGLIQGSPSAPTPTAFQDWLNALKILHRDIKVETRVLVSHEVQRLLRQSEEVSLISVRVHTNRADALRARGARLSQVLDTVKAEYGDMDVTVILRPGRSKDRRAARRAIRDEAARIAAASDNAEVRKASAKLIYVAADEKARSEDVDFAKQRITAKRNIGTTADDGSPIRNASAVQAILDVAQEHDQELRAIVLPG